MYPPQQLGPSSTSWCLIWVVNSKVRYASRPKEQIRLATRIRRALAALVPLFAYLRSLSETSRLEVKDSVPDDVSPSKRMFQLCLSHLLAPSSIDNHQGGRHQP